MPGTARVLPVPVLPTAMAFSRRWTYSQRARSRTMALGTHKDAIGQRKVTAIVVVHVYIYIYYYYDSGHSGLTNGRARKKRMPPDAAGGILRGRSVVGLHGVGPGRGVESH